MMSNSLHIKVNGTHSDGTSIPSPLQLPGLMTMMGLGPAALAHVAVHSTSQPLTSTPAHNCPPSGPLLTLAMYGKRLNGTEFGQEPLQNNGSIARNKLIINIYGMGDFTVEQRWLQ